MPQTHQIDKLETTECHRHIKYMEKTRQNATDTSNIWRRHDRMPQTHQIYGEDTTECHRHIKYMEKTRQNATDTSNIWRRHDRMPQTHQIYGEDTTECLEEKTQRWAPRGNVRLVVAVMEKKDFSELLLISQEYSPSNSSQK